MPVPKGAWKSTDPNMSHFVPEGSMTSLCGLRTLDTLSKDEKWLPPGREGHCCGKCQAQGAELPAGGCPCPVHRPAGHHDYQK